jgi:hypothetical protein
VCGVGFLVAGIFSVWLRSGSFPYGRADAFDYVVGSIAAALSIFLGGALWSVRRK